MDIARTYTIDVLTQFDLTHARLKDIRDNICDQHNIKGSDHQRVTALTNDVIRWRGRIDLWLRELLDRPNRSIKPELKNLIRSGLYEILLDKKTPDYAAVNSYVEIAKSIFGARQSKFVNAILRKASSVQNNSIHEESLHEWYSLPKWLWDRWRKQFGLEKVTSLAEFYLCPVKIDIRRNNEQLSHENLIQFCLKNDVTITTWDNSHVFYHVEKHFARLRSLLLEKKIFVQDRAAGMVVELIAPEPGEIIMDVCAAPGGKTTYISELIGKDGQLLAFDNDADRIKKMEQLKNITIERKDAEKDEFPNADVILIDAPCSGTGVVGKKPDIRWRRKKNEIQEFAELQKRILIHMSKFVNPGGRIIYSTCSLEPEENWGVIDAFLKFNDQYYVDMETRMIPSKFQDVRGAFFSFPPFSSTDGMFAVRLLNES